jgi:hypothetical protein
LIRGCEIDTAVLSHEEASRLNSLVKESGILSAESSRSERARDLITYEITISTEEGARHVSFDDSTVPPAAEGLLEYLTARAEARPLS